MFEKTEGTVKNIAGKVQEAVGNAVGDTDMEAEGVSRQVGGKAQAAYGDVLNQVRSSAMTNPLATVATMVGAGFILGVLWSKR